MIKAGTKGESLLSPCPTAPRRGRLLATCSSNGHLRGMPPHPAPGFRPTPDGPFLQLLDAAAVERLLDPAELLDALEEGFRWLELGEVETPPRPLLPVADRGISLTMSAWRPGMQLSVKIVNVFEGNARLGLPTHAGLIALFDPDTGMPTCVLDAASITALRTSGAAVLSARMLARPDARVATVVGGGVQAATHLRLLPLLGGLRQIQVWSRNPEATRRIVEGHPLARATTDLEMAIRGSDLVCLTTGAREPVIRPEWIRPGTHVSSVGYAPPGSELPGELVTSHRLFVETLSAFEAPPVGCVELAGLEPSRGTTLGAVSLGRRPGRQRIEEVTVYTSMGNAMEDMVAANLAYRAALAGT